MGIEETIKNLRKMLNKMESEEDIQTIENAIIYIRGLMKTSQRIHDIVTNLQIVKRDSDGVSNERVNIGDN